MWSDISYRFRDTFRRDSIVIPASIRIAIGIFVATLIAYALGNQRPYWVPIACSAVLLGKHIMATIHRAVQRAIGTCIGIVIAGVIFSIHPSFLILALLCFMLQTAVELIVGRNYALAVIFITPLGLIVTMSANTGLTPLELIHARLIDNLLGIGIGLISGLLLWRRSGSKRLRLVVARSIRCEGALLQSILSRDPNHSEACFQYWCEMDRALSHMEYIYQTARHEFPRPARVVDELRTIILSTKDVAEGLRDAAEEQDKLFALYDDHEQVQTWFEKAAQSVEQNSDFVSKETFPFFDAGIPLVTSLRNLKTSVIHQVSAI